MGRTNGCDLSQRGWQVEIEAQRADCSATGEYRATLLLLVLLEFIPKPYQRMATLMPWPSLTAYALNPIMTMPMTIMATGQPMTLAKYSYVK